MKTREINIKRHQAFIDDFPMSVNDLIHKLEAAKKLADGKQVVGFRDSGAFSIFNENQLIVQWDQVVPDEEPDAKEGSDA